MLVAVVAEPKPLLCVFLQIMISMAILAYLIVMKPFIKKVNQYQLCIYEFGVFLLNISVGLLTVIGVSNSSFPRASNVLVNIVIGGNDALNIMVLVFLAIKLCLEASSITKATRKQGIKGMRRMIVYLQLFSLPLQLGNMGFEEMISYDIYSNRRLKSRRAVTPVKMSSNYVNLKEMALQGGSPLYSVSKLDSPESRRALTSGDMNASALSNANQRTRIFEESVIGDGRGEIKLLRQGSGMSSMIDLNSPPQRYKKETYTFNNRGDASNPDPEDQLYAELYAENNLPSSRRGKIHSRGNIPRGQPIPVRNEVQLIRQSSAADYSSSLIYLDSPQRNYADNFFNNRDDGDSEMNVSYVRGKQPTKSILRSPTQSIIGGDGVGGELRLLRHTSGPEKSSLAHLDSSKKRNKNDMLYDSYVSKGYLEKDDEDQWATEKDLSPRDETHSISIFGKKSSRFKDKVKKKLTRSYYGDKAASHMNY